MSRSQSDVRRDVNVTTVKVWLLKEQVQQSEPQGEARGCPRVRHRQLLPSSRKRAVGPKAAGTAPHPGPSWTKPPADGEHRRARGWADLDAQTSATQCFRGAQNTQEHGLQGLPDDT